MEGESVSTSEISKESEHYLESQVDIDKVSGINITESPTESPQESPKDDEINEDVCDDIIKAIVQQSKSEVLKAEADKDSTYNPDCEVHGIPAKQYKPCPDGARPCCTCGVCPLDLAEGRDKSQTEAVYDAEYDAEHPVGSSTRGSTISSTYGSESEYTKDEGKMWEQTKWDKRKWDQTRWGMLGYGGEGGFYFSPTMSARSRHEGSIVEDYTKFLIEPLEICYGSLSSLSSSYISCEDAGLQRTIVIVKPQAVQFKETIYRVFFEAGFQILGLRVLHLSPEQVSEIYSKYYGSPSFVHLVVSVSESPVLAICISALNVIKRWLKIIGPDGSLRAEWFYPLSMRKLFGLNDTHADWIHGSENVTDSNKENRYFYPDNILEPILQEEDKVWDYCTMNINKSLLAGCTEVVKRRPADPIIFLADYLLFHNPFQPRLPRNLAMTPTGLTTFWSNFHVNYKRFSEVRGYIFEERQGVSGKGKGFWKSQGMEDFESEEKELAIIQLQDSVSVSRRSKLSTHYIFEGERRTPLEAKKSPEQEENDPKRRVYKPNKLLKLCACWDDEKETSPTEPNTLSEDSGRKHWSHHWVKKKKKKRSPSGNNIATTYSGFDEEKSTESESQNNSLYDISAADVTFSELMNKSSTTAQSKSNNSMTVVHSKSSLKVGDHHEQTQSMDSIGTLEELSYSMKVNTSGKEESVGSSMSSAPPEKVPEKEEEEEIANLQFEKKLTLFAPSKSSITLDDLDERETGAYDFSPKQSTASTVMRNKGYSRKFSNGSTAYSKTTGLIDSTINLPLLLKYRPTSVYLPITEEEPKKEEPEKEESEKEESEKEEPEKEEPEKEEVEEEEEIDIGVQYFERQLLQIEPLEEVRASSTIFCDDFSNDLERTLVLIKPIAMQYKDVILKTIFDHGFQIVNQRVLHLNPEQVAELYPEYYGSPSFVQIVQSISSAPVLVLSLAAINAVIKWQNIIGLEDSVRREWFYPFSVQKNFGLIDSIPDAIKSSETHNGAKQENRYVFPDSLLDPIKSDLDEVTDYCNQYINQTLTMALQEIVQKRPVEPILYLADWVLSHNPFKPRISPCRKG